MTVAVLSLVSTGIVAEIGPSSFTGDSSSGSPGDSRGVVAAVDDCGIANVVCGGHEGHLTQETRVFQVAVGHVASWVVDGY